MPLLAFLWAVACALAAALLAAARWLDTEAGKAFLVRRASKRATKRGLRGHAKPRRVFTAAQRTKAHAAAYGPTHDEFDRLDRACAREMQRAINGVVDPAKSHRQRHRDTGAEDYSGHASLDDASYELTEYHLDGRCTGPHSRTFCVQQCDHCWQSARVAELDGAAPWQHQDA